MRGPLGAGKGVGALRANRGLGVNRNQGGIRGPAGV